jgi:hypothetical protein
MATPVKTSWAIVLLMLCLGLRHDAIAQDSNPKKPPALVAQESKTNPDAKSVDSTKSADALKSTGNTAILEGKVIDDLVIDDRGKLVAGASIFGIYDGPPDRNRAKLEKAVTSKDGSFTLSREPIAVLLEAVSPNGRLVGISRVPADRQEAAIHVHPSARVTGVYVDSAGKPVTVGWIMYGIRVPENGTIGTQFSRGSAILDSEGRFTIAGLIPDERYDVLYKPRGRGVIGGSMQGIGSVRPTASETVDMGRIVNRARISTNDRSAAPPTKPLADEFARAASDTEVDLLVQRAVGNNDDNNTVPAELAILLSQVRGVKQVYGGMIDQTSFANMDQQRVLIQGWPADCPVMAKLKVQSGGRQLTTRDSRKTLLGVELAKKLGKKVGDKIELYGMEDFEVVGVYVSANALENDGLVVTLRDLPRLMSRDQEVTGFAITVERPIDEQGLEDIRHRLEAVQPGLEVTIVHSH